jgi:hypothetical protein
LFGLNFEGFANSQHGKHREGPSGLDHLPMPHAEPVGLHILLAQPAFGSQASDSVAEGAKESRIVTRQVSAGAHLSRLSQHEQRHHDISRCSAVTRSPTEWSAFGSGFAREFGARDHFLRTAPD